MKIYDCFSYWDEDLLLDLRLNILNDFVDYFVIVEGNKTWQNNQHIYLKCLILFQATNLHLNMKNSHKFSSIFPS